MHCVAAILRPASPAPRAVEAKQNVHGVREGVLRGRERSTNSTRTQRFFWRILLTFRCS